MKAGTLAFLFLRNRSRLKEVSTECPKVKRIAVCLSKESDIELRWTPAPGDWISPIAGDEAAPLADGPSLLTAIQEATWSEVAATKRSGGRATGT
jgi:hypothetical protein